MQILKEYYFPALAEYVRYGGEASLIRANKIGKRFARIDLDTVLFIHDECTKSLAVNADPTKVVELYDRSFVFFMEMMETSYLSSNESNSMQFFEPNIGTKDEVMLHPSFNHKTELTTAIRELHIIKDPFTEKIKNKYENVLQQMDNGIALFDSKGRLTFANNQLMKLLQIPDKLLYGLTMKQLLFHSELDSSLKLIMIEVYREMVLKERTSYEFRYVDGRQLEATLTCGDPLEGDYLFSLKDVSEFRLVEQSALQNEKLAMLGKISASIAHEIRNPLTSIRGFIQLIRPYLYDIGKEDYARIILSEIDRANDIIHEFLNSSKPSAPMKENASINSLLHDAIVLIDGQALMQNCELIFNQLVTDLFVSIDVKQMKQVVLNILRNALEAVQMTDEFHRSKVTVEVNSNGNFAEITIQDNGKGMDKATMSKLFEPFYTTKSTGTGLGLSVSERIIRNHGGSIRVNSIENCGTVFVISLPLLT
ncbi:ATP-binding protein [Paenibacillus yanchengensis]|uniref:histidine kinase n=1 Tax=Paenibacillus yanchengensis TaxID=2035833 RepID=A0ABW4YG53_9BACL